jgi:arabinose-5-phosphate isomerase
MVQHKSEQVAIIIEAGRQVIETEAVALQGVANQLDLAFAQAVMLISNCQGKLICCGMGKAGLIAQKVAATFASTGVPAFFLHPADAMHGDLGMVVAGDIALLFSHSGESEEIVRLLPHLARRQVQRIAITARQDSSLGRQCETVITLGELLEACPLQLAPSSSTTALLAVGDALALTTLQQRGFTTNDYAQLHPGGSLGRAVSQVEELMRTGPRCPCCLPTMTVRQVLANISQARAGLACIVDHENHLLGVFTDGDFRRQWASDPLIGEQLVGDVMTHPGLFVAVGTLVRTAKELMATRHINALPVINAQQQVLGILDLQDLV